MLNKMEDKIFTLTGRILGKIECLEINVKHNTSNSPYVRNEFNKRSLEKINEIKKEVEKLSETLMTIKL